MTLIDRLKGFFSCSPEYYKNGQWISAADTPMFVPNLKIVSTIIPEKKNDSEIVDTDQKKLDS